MSKDLSFEDWQRDPGIYASYDDYLKGMRGTREYYKQLDRKEERKKLAKAVAKELKKK